MAESELQTRERSYRDASRGYDYFTTGLASVLFLATAIFFEANRGVVVSATLELAATILFALAVFTGLKKLEYYLAILGAGYSIALTESNQTTMTARESIAVLRDLNETVESLSNRAAFVHRVRHWCLVLGVLAMIASLALGGALV